MAKIKKSTRNHFTPLCYQKKINSLATNKAYAAQYKLDYTPNIIMRCNQAS